VALVALVAALGGFAIAAVPDKKGRIVACYEKRGGDLRVLQKGTKCKRAEKRIRWSQKGRRGPAGQDGAPGAPGRSAASMLTGNTMNIPVAPGTTKFLAPSGPSDTWGATTFAETLSPNTPVVARDLAIELGGPPGAGESYVVTLQIAGTDTPLTCTVAGASAASCSNSTAAVPIPARSPICFKVVVSAGAVTRRVLFGWRAVGPPT